MRKSTLKRFLSLPYFEEHMQMHLADCMASHGQTDAYDFIREKMEEYGREEIRAPAASRRTGPHRTRVFSRPRFF